MPSPSFLQSINPWSPVSAKHNCILSWALISKIEIISQIASAWGVLPCCHVLQQSLSQKGLEQQKFGCAGLWGGSTFYLRLERTAFLWSFWHSCPRWDSVPWKCLCWYLFISHQKKASAGARGHRPRCGAFKALESPVLPGCSAAMHLQAHLPNRECKCFQSAQDLPRAAAILLCLPQPSHHLQSPSHSHLFLWIWEAKWKRQKICYTGDASLPTAVRTFLPQEPNIYIRC